MPLAAICPRHGAFPVRPYATHGTLQVSGNIRSCPICGADSREVDGHFLIGTESQVTVLSAPSWSIEALNIVNRNLMIAKRYATDSRIPDLEAERKIDQVFTYVRKTNPTIADEYEKRSAGAPRRRRASLIASLMTAANIMGAVVNGADFIELAGEAFSWVVDQVENGFTPSPEEIPSELLPTPAPTPSEPSPAPSTAPITQE